MKNITNQKQNLINPRQDLQGFKNLEPIQDLQGLKQGSTLKSKLNLSGLNTILLIISILLFIPTTQAQEETPEWQWMHSMGGTFQLGTFNPRQHDYVRDMKADKWGNIYMTGNFVRDITIQDTLLEAPFNGPNNNNADIFIAKFNCEGNLEWAKRGGDPTTGDYGKLLLLGRENIYWVGQGTGGPFINNMEFTMDQQSIGNFIGQVMAKMDTDGNITTLKSADRVVIHDKCAVLDEDENIYMLITASPHGPSEYDGVELDPGFYLLKVDSNFNYLHHELIADLVTDSDIEFNTIKLDSEGNILMGGAVKNEDIDIYGFDTNVYGFETFFLLKIDESYNPLWIKQPECVINGGGSSSSKLFDVVLDDNDNIYISSYARSYGDFFGTWYGCWFEEDTVYNFNHNRGIRAVFIKYSAEGNQEWVKFVQGDNNGAAEFPKNIKLYLDEETQTLYTYAICPSGLFDYDTFSSNITGRGMYVMQIDTNGGFVDINFIQTNPSNPANFYDANQFALMNNGNYYIGGVHYDYLDFPDSILVPLWGSGSNRDIYLAKYGTTECYRCDSIIVNFEVQPNNQELLITANHTLFAENYLWDFGNDTLSSEALPLAVQYADTGTYEVCLTATSFCDSATFCEEVFIGCPSPNITSFSLVAEELNLSVENTDVNNYEQLTWSWGDGNTTIDELNPMYQYADTGTYEVCLTATNSCGIDNLCEIITISHEEEPNPDTTSIITLENGGKVMAYPNPMQNTLVLKMDNKSMAKNYKYKILDALGKVVVKSSPINQTNQSIKVSHLSSGIYFLHIYNQKESHSVHLMKE